MHMFCYIDRFVDKGPNRLLRRRKKLIMTRNSYRVTLIAEKFMSTSLISQVLYHYLFCTNETKTITKPTYRQPE